MLIPGTSVTEVAADVVAGWAELSRVPLGAVSPQPQARGKRWRERDADVDSDALDRIPPREYVEALTGVEIPHHGSICCPLPDHDERNPSFRAYDDPARGWFCFGCGRGGTIFDFGAALWGMDTRGRAFHELRRELARELVRGA